MVIKLKWSELQSIEEIDFFEEFYGIYIWGFKIKSGFIPYYVGIAFNSSISKRLIEHVNNLIGGKYCVIHKNSLNQFYDYKESTDISKEKGLIYMPNWPDGYIRFIKERNFISEHINYMVDNMYFTYTILDDKIFKTKKDYEDVESACINSINKKYLWNVRSKKTNIEKIILEGDKDVLRHFKVLNFKQSTFRNGSIID